MTKQEIKDTALELLNNLERRAINIKEQINENNFDEILNRLYTFTEDILVLMEGLMFIDLEQNKFQVSDMNQKLEEILNAFQLHDPLYVSDLIGQEIIPLLSFWKEKLIEDGNY